MHHFPENILSFCITNLFPSIIFSFIFSHELDEKTSGIVYIAGWQKEEENEAIITNTPGQSQGNTPIIDVTVTKVIKLVLNRHGRWYHCLFSDNKEGFLHYNERHRIPEIMRNEIHSKFTWKMKRKIKNKSNK